MRQWLRAKADAWREAVLRRLRSASGLWIATLLLVVFGIAAYIRMHDAVTTAPPALSDGNVTLEWMKYIDDRVLFASGVYPQGFHITLDTIHKFASIDWLYVLKYMGPFNMLLVMLGMYLYVSRLSGSKASGVVAAAVFGLLGGQFGGPFDRQAATNSQEFGFVFVFPTLYFLHRFLKERRRDDLFVAGAGMAVTGMVHSLAYAYLGMGVALTLGWFLLAEGRRVWRSLVEVCAAGAASVAASLAPIGIGLYILGRDFHSSSVDYLTSEDNGEAPTAAAGMIAALRPVDVAAIVGLAVLAVALLLTARRFRQMSAYWVTFLLGAASFVLYQWGGVLTNSLVVATRAGELWALAVPVAIGMASHAAVSPAARGKLRQAVPLVFATAGVAAMLAWHPPQPIETYKMTWNSNVEQYLRISSEFRPRTWLIVSKDDDYAVIFGSGFHLRSRELIEKYDPKKEHLTLFGETKPDKNVPNDIFLYVEKQVFRVEETNSIYPLKEPDYARYEQEAAQIEEWVQVHMEAGHPVEVYYEDEILKVYRLHREETRQEIMERIWGS
ncbi:MAG TPA: hypothetical protein VEZ72_21730, partial [Paenibacillus sp.]|nr:hypothetical protein [Paenibacillus sp.]